MNPVSPLNHPNVWTNILGLIAQIAINLAGVLPPQYAWAAPLAQGAANLVAHALTYQAPQVVGSAAPPGRQGGYACVSTMLLSLLLVFTLLLGTALLSGCSTAQVEQAQTDVTTANQALGVICQTAAADAAVLAPASVPQVNAACAAIAVGGALAATDAALLQSLATAKAAAQSKTAATTP